MTEHWYKRDGTPCYKQEKKTKPGKMRATNLGDARKLGLVPSVTGIIKEKAAPGLERWKRDQILKACLEIDRDRDEPEEAYIVRVVAKAQEISENAAKLGIKVHKAIEEAHKAIALGFPGMQEHLDIPESSLLQHYLNWQIKEIKKVIVVELPFACPEGYGGKLDIAYIDTEDWFTVTDFKTQATRPGKPVNSYPEHGMQLAACANGAYPGKDVKLKNIIISTTEPGRIEIVDWTDRKEKMLESFRACLTLWKNDRDFDPAFSENT